MNIRKAALILAVTAASMNTGVPLAFALEQPGTGRIYKTAATEGTMGDFAVQEASGEWAPSGICGIGDGEFLVTDIFSKVIWKVKDGKRSLYAGRSGARDIYGEPVGGCRDGSLMELQMRLPWDIVPYMDGYAVSDSKNNMIRYIAGAKTRTAAGAGDEGYEDGLGGRALFSGPTGLAAAPDGTLYIADTGNGVIRRLSSSGRVDTYVRNLSSPTGLCFYDGVLYVAETGNHRILKVTDGTVEWFAGKGTEGSLDGSAAEAQFSRPQRITAAADGTFYVSDTGSSAVRRIRQGRVETLPPVQEGGIGMMTEPAGLWVAGDTLYVCDSFSRKIHTLPR